MVVPSFWKVTITWVFHYEEFEAQGEVNLPRAASHYYQAFFPPFFELRISVNEYVGIFSAKNRIPFDFGLIATKKPNGQVV